MPPVLTKEYKGDTFLDVKNVTKTFGRFVALEDVSIEVYPGELVCILGPSGCGKTTLLRVIAGLEEQNVGQVLLKGKDISRMPTSQRECGIVFQSYALFPNLTAIQNVAYGLKGSKYEKGEKISRTQEMLDLVDLGEIGKKYPAQLSGGQQQRVALARALAPSPSMLLLDEPLSALDAQVRVYLRSEIRDLQQRLQITTIMVTHDQEEALTMADRIILMDAGRIIQCASPQTIYHTPDDTFVAGFIGVMNFLEGWTVEDENTLTYGKLTLKTMDGKTKQYQGKETTVTVRPEDIRVLDEEKSGENILSTVVEKIEFRGASYRLYLRLKIDDPDLEAPVIEADLAAEKIERLEIKPESILPVYFPPERLLIFKHTKS
jgi:iron(III) transport system ATP-binding protein